MAVIIGASGGDKPTRGNFVAVDAQTGKLAWRVYTVPGDPSLPFKARPCARPRRRGVATSSRMAAAVRCGMASPTTPRRISSTLALATHSHGWRSSRGAQGLDNLYTCSILAVDLTTGQIKWHYQAVPNDNWDYDNVQQLTLLDLPINGRMRKVITQALKNGFFYVLDRLTGEFLSAEPFVKVVGAAHGHRRQARGKSGGVLRSGTDLRCFRPAAARITGRPCRTTTPVWSISPRPTRATRIRRRQSWGLVPLDTNAHGERRRRSSLLST